MADAPPLPMPGAGELEAIARKAAFWHGQRQVGGGLTVSASHGYGPFADGVERYAENHWRDYLGVAEAMAQYFLVERTESENAG